MAHDTIRLENEVKRLRAIIRDGVPDQGSDCPECGFMVPVDEDGLCISCGCDVMWYHPAIYKAKALKADNTRLRAEIDRFKKADLTEIPFTEDEVKAMRSISWSKMNDLASSHEILRAVAQALDVANIDLRASLAAAEEKNTVLGRALRYAAQAVYYDEIRENSGQTMAQAVYHAVQSIAKTAYTALDSTLSKQDSEVELSDEAIAALAEAERGEWLSDEEVRGQPVSNCDKLVQPDTEEE